MSSLSSISFEVPPFEPFELKLPLAEAAASPFPSSRAMASSAGSSTDAATPQKLGQLRRAVQDSVAVPIKGTLPVHADDAERRRTAVDLMSEHDTLQLSEAERGIDFGRSLPGVFWQQKAERVVDAYIDTRIGGPGPRSCEMAFRETLTAALQRCRKGIIAQRAAARTEADKKKAQEDMENFMLPDYMEHWLHGHRRCKSGQCLATHSFPPTCLYM